jgi:glycosyltransferase involved in cell wall biosynthesis
VSSVSARPLVSICLPTYNRGPQLLENLETVLRQDYTPLEIVISDNASTDGTEATCRALAAADPRVRYFRQPKNIGVHGNHNFCIEASTGDLLCFMHDHDERDLSIVSKYAAFLADHPEVAVVCSDWELIDPGGRIVGIRDHDVPAITPGREYIEQAIRSGRSSVGIPAAMVRREALGSARMGLDAPTGFADFVMWFEVAERWSIGHIHERLWRWRQQPVSLSARTVESLCGDYYTNMMGYCDAHLRRWPGHAALVARWREAIRNYLFWALMYEVGLYYRAPSPDRIASGRASLPEILNYRLSPEEFGRVLQLLREYRTGPVQHALYAALMAMLKLRVTWPIAAITEYQSSLRAIVGLK